MKVDARTRIEKKRLATLFTKEPGTIEWLAELHTGDVFFDVGANIGLYSLIAARFGAKVFAFEPHRENFNSLERNIALSRLDVTAFKVAVGDYDGTGVFNYPDLTAGASGGQLGHCISEDGEVFSPVSSEEIMVRKLSSMGLPAPTRVKIDVDGNELSILKGMVLPGPVSVQVEGRGGVKEFMEANGYSLAYIHYTASGRPNEVYKLAR